MSENQLDPELSPPLAFNDSHDGSYVLLGIARGQDTVIGVDLMQLPTDPLPVQEGISEQVTPISNLFPNSADELQLLAAEKRALPSDLSMNDRARRVTTFWTVKEGYTKAIGEGIGFGLERIRVDLDERGEVRMVCVDGRDVRDDGWRWECGWLGRDEGYGWVVFWKGDEEKEVGEEDGVTNQVKDIAWTEFLCQFDET